MEVLSQLNNVVIELVTPLNPITSKPYAPHELRVLSESIELYAKLRALRDFFKTDIFASLNTEDQELLIEQESAMSLYHGILNRRIERFS